MTDTTIPEATPNAHDLISNVADVRGVTLGQLVGRLVATTVTVRGVLPGTVILGPSGEFNSSI